MLRRRRATLARIVLLAALPAAAACSDDGRELAPPRPGQTTTTESEVTITGPSSEVFTLSSEAFADGDPLPERFTCTGAGVSPPLAWTSIPPSIELALVVRDRDADGYVHWIVTGIDPAISGFGEGGVPEGAVEQANTTGAIGWLPACPPQGAERHVYDFTLHSLDAPLDIDPALPAADVAALVEDASPHEARLSGTVTPPAG